MPARRKAARRPRWRMSPRALGKRATIFVAQAGPKPHPRTLEAARLGAQGRAGLAPGYLTVRAEPGPGVLPPDTGARA